MRVLKSDVGLNFSLALTSFSRSSALAFKSISMNKAEYRRVWFGVKGTNYLKELKKVFEAIGKSKAQLVLLEIFPEEVLVHFIMLEEENTRLFTVVRDVVKPVVTTDL